jgi:hypothetical protein
VLSGMSHKWDDAPTKTVADPVFAKMAPVPERQGRRAQDL